MVADASSTEYKEESNSSEFSTRKRGGRLQEHSCRTKCKGSPQIFSRHFFRKKTFSEKNVQKIFEANLQPKRTFFFRDAFDFHFAETELSR